MLRSDEAFLLATRDLGDADLIVIFLTRSHGRISGVARSARRSRKRFGGVLESMARVRLRWYEREDRDLQRIDGVDLERSYATMQSDPEIQAACAVFSEILQALGDHEGGDERAFRLLGAVLDALADGEPTLPVVRYFEAWVLRLNGLDPELIACAACHRPLGKDVRVARDLEGPRCPDCSRKERVGTVRIGEADLRFLRAIAERPPRGLARHRSAARPDGAVEALLRGGLQHYLERPLRTYRHLAQMTVTSP
jgi:DNA repair protein RecO (recombination protein O)